MPYTVNEDVLAEMLDNVSDLERSDRVFTVISKMRRIIQHISQADVNHLEDPLEKLKAQIEANALPATLPDGEDTLGEFRRFYEKTKAYIDVGLTEFGRTERGFITALDDLCEFANFIQLIENNFNLRVSDSVKVHLTPLTTMYLTSEN